MKIQNGNLFARFAVDKGQINQQRVHFRIFQPPKDLRLSTHSIDKLNYQDIVIIGLGVAGLRGKKLFGWAKVERTSIEEVGLEVEIDNDPNPGHATITGWPNDVSMRKQAMMKLATMSTSICYTDT